MPRSTSDARHPKTALRPVAAAMQLAATGALLAATIWAPTAYAGSVSTAAPTSASDSLAAPEQALEKLVVTGKRERRVSKGATNLPLEIKDTPQTISTIDKDTLRNFGASGSNDALRFGTGLVVDEWETNRTSYQARGFDVMLTQVDGLGMTNDWGLVESQKDTYLYERIELIRGANGLLTGVGNASGTINFVRKRPTNQDGGEVIASYGSYAAKRLALDYNKVLSSDGAWAGRLVVAHEDKDSHLRALHNQRSTVYGVVDGQIGNDGMLTLGFTVQDAKQRSPMWGSLTLPYANGSLADFDVSASTAQDWARWNNRSVDMFAEYTHTLSHDWEGKLTYSHHEGDDSSKLFYAYTDTGYLNDDNTGLYGWAYRDQSESSADVFNANLNGRFSAFGRKHELTIGLSYAEQKNDALSYDATGYSRLPLPAFPYPGNIQPEPAWGATSVAADGQQQITRLYGASRLAMTDRLKGIVGFNAISLKRDGTSIYGGGVALDNETTEEISPYIGATFDITPDLLSYASYSDIFQAQDQRDINGAYLDPMKGVNAEVGVKAEWLGRKLLTTFAIFTAKQQGLATYAGTDAGSKLDYYAPKDVKSRGFELEATGRVGKDTHIAVGYTQLKLTGPDGKDIYEWVPRRTLSARIDTRLAALPALRLGAASRWQSDVSKIKGAKQDAYALVNVFAAYEVNKAATLRLNIDNLFDKKYLRTVQFGAIYGAPRTAALALEYKL
ncbi:TonB-dependent siderophore receptor [Chitinimonas taiwanensis]|uniref:TonB-dependent siderophore receptor n=1 Tax=Chitinimonas taiwanensis TaxID=240412 RepID=UPI0035B4A2F2